jgi:hypothetical protein
VCAVRRRTAIDQLSATDREIVAVLSEQRLWKESAPQLMNGSVWFTAWWLGPVKIRHAGEVQCNHPVALTLSTTR